MVKTLDIDFMGQPGVIASCLIEGPDGLALVDPGPTTGLDGLRAALGAVGHALEEVEAVLVTHIHLDHSGGVGVMVRSNPRLQVYVHERGAPHVVDPSRLVSSATRLYGEHMDPRWGAIPPVPGANVTPLTGGDGLRTSGTAVGRW